MRGSPQSDAARLIHANVEPALLPRPAILRGLPSLLAPLGVAGGAVHDALVALAAKAAGVALATRDARAAGTYALIGIDIEFIARG